MAKTKQVFEKYDIVGVEPGIHTIAGFGTVDLTKLTLEEADNLFKNKFPFLAKKSKSDSPESPE